MPDRPLSCHLSFFVCSPKQLLHHQLLFILILYQLVPDVFLYRSLIPPHRIDIISTAPEFHRIDIISTAPEFPVPVSVLQVREPVEYHQTALPLQVSHHARHAVLRRYRHQHMYMIGTGLCFQYLDFFPFCIAPSVSSRFQCAAARRSPVSCTSVRTLYGICSSIWYELDSHYPFPFSFFSVLPGSRTFDSRMGFSLCIAKAFRNLRTIRGFRCTKTILRLILSIRRIVLSQIIVIHLQAVSIFFRDLVVFCI